LQPLAIHTAKNKTQALVSPGRNLSRYKNDSL